MPWHYSWEEAAGTHGRSVESGASAQKRTRPSDAIGHPASSLVRIPSSVLIKAPLALTSSSRPRHLQPLCADRKHRNDLGR